MFKKLLTISVLSLCLSLITGPVQSQPKSKEVILIINSGPGGLMHRYAMELQPELSNILGRPVVIEFKPGGNGTVAARALESARSDRLTLMLGAAMPEVEVDQVNSMQPLVYLGLVPGVVVARSDIKYRNLRELLNDSKDKKYSYGIANSGATVPLMRGLVDKYSSPANIQEIFYKSGGQVVTDLAGGHTTMGVTVTSGVISYIEDGKFRALAILGDRRSQLLPNVPTLSELGLSVPNERHYYHHIFLWANPAADGLELQEFRVKFANWVKNGGAKEIFRRMDVSIDTNLITTPKPLIRSIVTTK